MLMYLIVTHPTPNLTHSDPDKMADVSLTIFQLNRMGLDQNR